jgi:hypothetical protein
MDRVPFSSDPVWAPVMRPLAPLLYLDINHYIELARVAGGKSTPAGYERLFHEVKRAVTQERVVVVLSSEHPYEMLGIKDPKQRAAVAAVMEEVAKFRYLLGGPELAQLEFEAGIAAGLQERLPEIPYPLVRQTALWAHGRKGGLTVRDSAGNDVTEQARQEVGPGKFDRMVRWGEFELERLILRGPTDEELPDLIARGWDGPSALASRESRLAFEQDTSRVLAENPKWRRGRLRDLISGREFVHEWLDMMGRVQLERASRGLPPIPDGRMHVVMAGMPKVQVAISMKTRYHRNPEHEWSVNDITDIDAMSVAFAYCDCLLTDNAARANLEAAKELRAISPPLPKSPDELSDWLEALPVLTNPWLLVPAGRRPSAEGLS